MLASFREVDPRAYTILKLITESKAAETGASEQSEIFSNQTYYLCALNRSNEVGELRKRGTYRRRRNNETDEIF